MRNEITDGDRNPVIATGSDGNDLIFIDTADIVSIHAGEGIDTLILNNGSGLPLDLTAIGDGAITGIDRMDITGCGNNVLTLSSDNVAAMSDSGTLTVLGDAGDEIHLRGQWQAGEDQVIGGATYTPYTLGDTTVLVAAAVTALVIIEGTEGADTLTGTSGPDLILGLDGPDILEGRDGADSLQGGAGNDILIFDPNDSLMDGGAGDKDVLRVDGSGVSLDLTAIDDALITGMERIDITGSGDNQLILSTADVLALSDTSDTLTILGDSGDRVTPGRDLDRFRHPAGG